MFFHNAVFPFLRAPRPGGPGRPGDFAVTFLEHFLADAFTASKMSSGLSFLMSWFHVDSISDPCFILFGVFLERGVENVKTQIQPLLQMS